jgi:hypothetical protein
LLKFGVKADAFHGIGSPRFGMPLTIVWAEPPTGGKINTSNFSRKFGVFRIT